MSSYTINKHTYAQTLNDTGRRKTTKGLQNTFTIFSQNMYKEFLAIIYKAFVIKRNTVTIIIVYEFSENFNIITHVCSNSQKTKKLPSEINRIVCIHAQNLPSPFIAQDLYFYMHVRSRPPLIVQYEYFFLETKII